MAWFKRKEKGITTATEDKKDVPKGLWYKSPTGKIVDSDELERNLWVSLEDDYHVRIGSAEYFQILFDDNKFEELDANLTSVDSLNFVDTKKYSDRLKEVSENMQLQHSNLSVKINAYKDYEILADAFHFSNIVYNLLDNSIKYCEGNPEIIITISENKNQLKLDFCDNGIGVSNTKLKLIFDKFSRIPSTKSNETNGFGLGLYYVKKICTQHHWKIEANNNNDNGLTISIEIPK